MNTLEIGFSNLFASHHQQQQQNKIEEEKIERNPYKNQVYLMVKSDTRETKLKLIC